MPALMDQLVWGIGDAQIAYEILATKHFEQFKDHLFTDLKDQFERVRTAYFERIADAEARRHVDESTRSAVRLKILQQLDSAWSEANDKYVREHYAIAALEGVVLHGGKEFTPFVRKIAENATFLTRNVAFRALAAVGDISDVPSLLQHGSQSYADSAGVALEAALRLTGNLGETARQVIGFGTEEAVRIGLRALAKAKPDEAVICCEELLVHKRDGIRKIAVAYLVSMLDDSSMQRTLEAQLSISGRYYDVVSWLDRILYAPGPVREAYRSELLSEIAK